MDDEEFKDRVLKQLSAIVSRLDDQDLAIDRLTGKVDRLAVLARAGEEALTEINSLSRRITRLENPDG